MTKAATKCEVCGRYISFQNAVCTKQDKKSLTPHIICKDVCNPKQKSKETD